MPRSTPANRSVEADFRALHNQVAELGDQLGALLSKAKQEGGAAAEAELGLLQEKLNTLLADAKDKGQEAWNKVEDTVRERPGTSLVTAFAAGAILAGLLLRR
ncbi:hypothetical protein [Ferrovibrio sp.]|uniref:hypothetical protein n=1 Tax=Ferrovibrio sp. TaxID=1917215 RepID=UPI0025C3CCEA|nr:hypothetical protein [Ferrovibrio sp.]MBX3456703.1 hypothetical protein [Ferrovibrio sp.]